jgi:Virulence activator alpha C-term
MRLTEWTTMVAGRRMDSADSDTTPRTLGVMRAPAISETFAPSEAHQHEAGRARRTQPLCRASQLTGWLAPAVVPEHDPVPGCGESPDPASARRLFAGQAARHRERLRQYERDWRQIEIRHNGGAPPVTHPEFGSYATLKCGIDHERQRIAWLQWLGRQLTAHQAGPTATREPGPADGAEVQEPAGREVGHPQPARADGDVDT